MHLLRRLKRAIPGRSWPETWAQSSARLGAAAAEARRVRGHPARPLADAGRGAGDAWAGWRYLGRTGHGHLLFDARDD